MDELTKITNRKAFEKQYKKCERRILFNIVKGYCKLAVENKPFYKGTKVLYPAATVKKIKTIFDTGKESTILSAERKAYFESFGYRYIPVTKSDIKYGFAEIIVQKTLWAIYKESQAKTA